MTVYDQLQVLGWSQNELARRLGLHVNTVSAWGIASMNTRVPKYAKAYLDLAVKLKEVGELIKKNCG